MRIGRWAVVGLAAMLAACSDEPRATEAPTPLAVRPTETAAVRPAPEPVDGAARARQLVLDWRRCCENRNREEGELERLELEIVSTGASAVPILMEVAMLPDDTETAVDRARSLVAGIGIPAVPVLCDRISAGSGADATVCFEILNEMDTAWTLDPIAPRVWELIARTFRAWTPSLEAPESAREAAARPLWAAGALVEHTGRAATPGVIRELASLWRRGGECGLEPPGVPYDLLWALGPDAVPAAETLAAWLAASPPDGRFDFRINVLRRIGSADTTIAPTLRTMLRADGSTSVVEALRVLETWGRDAEAFQPELEALLESEDRAVAARAWLRMAAFPGGRTAAKRTLADFVFDHELAGWAEIVRALPRLDLTDRDWSALLADSRLLESSTAEPLMWEIAGRPSAYPSIVFERMARHDTVMIRAAVAEVGPEAVARTLLDDPVGIVRACVMWRFDIPPRVPTEEEVAAALRALDSGTERDRRDAIRTIGAVLPRHENVLLAYVEDARNTDRDLAVSKLAEAPRAERHVPLFLDALLDPNEAVRRSAVAGLHESCSNVPTLASTPAHVQSLIEVAFAERGAGLPLAALGVLARMDGGAAAIREEVRSRLRLLTVETVDDRRETAPIPELIRERPEVFSPLRDDLEALRRRLREESRFSRPTWLASALELLGRDYDALALTSVLHEREQLLRTLLDAGPAGHEAIVLLVGHEDAIDGQEIPLERIGPVAVRLLRDGDPSDRAKTRLVGAARLVARLEPETGIPLLVAFLQRSEGRAAIEAYRSLARLARAKPELVPITFVRDALRNGKRTGYLAYPLAAALGPRLRALSADLRRNADDSTRWDGERMMAAELLRRATGDVEHPRRIVREALIRFRVDPGAIHRSFDDPALEPEPWAAVAAILGDGPEDRALLESVIEAVPAAGTLDLLPLVRRLGDHAAFAVPKLGATLLDLAADEEDVTPILDVLASLGRTASPALPYLRLAAAEKRRSREEILATIRSIESVR